MSAANTNRINPACVRSSALAIAALLVASGCRESTDVRPVQREGRGAPTFSYAGGGGSSARVTRSRTPDGGERLHGETVLVLGVRASRCVIEDVTLDAGGRLTRAEITVAAACDRPAEKRLILDAASGAVRASTAGETVSWRAPSDAPWVYTPPSLVATPVSAWVTARAAAGAPSVRQVEHGSAHAALVAREQIAIETERGLTVIVGNDGVDVDAVFVEQVRLADYGVTLQRVATSGTGGGRS